MKSVYPFVRIIPGDVNLYLASDFDQIERVTTEEMVKRVENKPIMKDIFPHGRFINTTEEFVKIFGVDKFKNEILA